MSEISAKKFLLPLFFILVQFLSGCNNVRVTSGTSPSSEVSLANPSSGSNGGSFQINGVYASQQSPGTLYDVIGTNNEFDVYCTGTNGPCVCEFTYISPGIGTMTQQGTITYLESNLLRCTNAVPSGVASFELKIKATGSGDESNTITTNLASGGFVNTTYVDLSKEEAYTMVKRFQCRRREWIANPMSPNFIDPMQSENPRVIYPFNFYTTNVADSLWQMQQSSNQNWECTLTPNQDYSVHWWANPMVFSSNSCGSSGANDPFCLSDGELIYPQNDLVSGKIPVSSLNANGMRRGSFHLAKQAYGVFQTPVRAAVGPLSYVTSNFANIGFAARPIPQSGGTSACPNITLPSNAKWVKLWNFRATDIDPPRVVSNSPAMTGNAIACNTETMVFESCFRPNFAPAMPGLSTSWRARSLADMGNSPSDPTFILESPIGSITYASSFKDQSNLNLGIYLVQGTLASRVGISGGGSSSALSPCYNITGMTSGREARESWDASPFAPAGVSVATINGLPWDIMSQVQSTNTCGTAYQWMDHVPGSSCYLMLTEKEPADMINGLQNTAALSPDSYSDQLFVVTHPGVNDTQMRNSATSISHYIPVTYRSRGDCNSASRIGNPNCLIANEINWMINVKEVGTNDGPDQFPLCVLQFED